MEFRGALGCPSPSSNLSLTGSLVCGFVHQVRRFLSVWEFSGSTPNLLAPSPILLAPPPVSLQECWDTGGTATACFMLYRGSGNPLHTVSHPCTESAFPPEPSPSRCLSAVTEVDGYNRKLSFRRGRVRETLASRLLCW